MIVCDCEECADSFSNYIVKGQRKTVGFKKNT